MNNITVILPGTANLRRWMRLSVCSAGGGGRAGLAFGWIPVIYGGAGGPDLAAVARHSGFE